ncbi:MAG: DUF975 family protein [Clostridia bacterium]
MKTCAEYRSLGRENLKGNWGTAILVCLVVSAVSTLLGFIPVAGTVITILLSGQLMVGEIIYFTKLNRKENPRVGAILTDFDKNWLKNCGAYILKMVYTFLWLLLFIIPGIVKNFAYSMTLYLKSRNPELKANEAIKLSEKMMDGHKWDLACLQFSFIGWIILSVLTCGIGFIFLIPYMDATEIAFMEEVYNNYQQANMSADETVSSNDEVVIEEVKEIEEK